MYPVHDPTAGPSAAAASAPSAPGRRALSAGSVLRAVLHHGPIPRSAVARLTGLSPASITGHSAELSTRGLLRELPEAAAASGMGRPHVPIDLDLSRTVVGGIHIAVEEATVALLDLGGAVIAERTVPHDEAGPAEILARCAGVLEQLLQHDGGTRRPLGLGVATGGWVDRAAGTVVEHPLLGWRQVPVGALLRGRLGMAVHVDSHARSLVRAEQLFGQARSRRSALVVFVGNVVDAAFAMGEQVNHGPRSQAGSVAHLPVVGSDERCSCGRTGCLQATVSERTLVRRAVELGMIGRSSIDELIAAAEGGHRGARELFRERSTLIGRGIAVLVDVLSPELVVVVEPGVTRFADCMDGLRAELARYAAAGPAAAQTVVATSFADTALATAAGTVMLDVIYRNPLAVQRYSRAS